jgi:hypothetical protein
VIYCARKGGDHWHPPYLIDRQSEISEFCANPDGAEWAAT